jgi:hypothetical protein
VEDVGLTETGRLQDGVHCRLGFRVTQVHPDQVQRI